jgi:hypothetical protein
MVGLSTLSILSDRFLEVNANIGPYMLSGRFVPQGTRVANLYCRSCWCHLNQSPTNPKLVRGTFLSSTPSPPSPRQARVSLRRLTAH